MKRFTRAQTTGVVALLTAVASLSPTFAADKVPPTPVRQPAAWSVDPARLTLRQVMNARLSRIHLDNAGIADALDYLRDVTKANIHVNWAALEAAGVDRGAPVSLKLRNVPVRKVFATLLAQASPNVPLAYYTQDGIVEITTRELADAQLVTRTYVVDDLLVDVPDFVGPSFNLASKTSGGSGGNGGGSGGGGGGLIESNTSNEEQQTGRTRAERADTLIGMIQQTVRPDIWESAGGPARISLFRGNLIVTAPRTVHEAIGGAVD